MATWVELAAYARERGIPERTLRRRAKALDSQQGNVLKSSGEPGARVRKWLLNVEAFEPPRRPQDPRIAELNARLDRLAKAEKSLRGEIERLRRRFASIGSLN